MISLAVGSKLLCQSSQNLRWLAQFVFPNAYDMPTAEAQGPCHLSVASFITGHLVNPEIPIALRDAQVFWAPVPETSIHENDKALLAEREIRSAKERDVSPPARDAGGAQQLRQGELSLLVAAPTNAGHHLRAFGLGENVDH